MKLRDLPGHAASAVLLLLLFSPSVLGAEPGPVDIGPAAEPGFHSFFGKVALGAREFDGVPFELKDAMIRVRAGKPQRLEFPPVTAEGVHFLHFTENAGNEIGAYTLVYADGTRQELPLKNGINIQDWWKPGIMPFAALAHSDGFMTADHGEQKIGFWRFSARNPHPDKPVAGLEFSNTDPSVTVNLIAVTLTAVCGGMIGGTPAWTTGMDGEEFFLAVLNQEGNGGGRQHMCAQLARVGTVKSVPTLAKFLNDESMSHAARLALAAMPWPEAHEALRAALPGSSGAVKAGLIESIGMLRAPGDVRLIAPALNDADPVVVMSAALALGRIGDRACVPPLKAFAKTATGRPQAVALDALLRCAEVMGQKHRRAAHKLYREIYAGWPEGLSGTAAYGGMIRTGGGKAKSLISAALLGGDPTLWEAALPAVRETEGGGVTKECAKILGRVPRAVLPGLIEALAQRGDKAAAPALAALVGDADPVVSAAAVNALALVGDGSSVPVLAAAAAGGGPKEDAAVKALTLMNAPDVSDALLERIQGADAAETAVIADVMGRRRDDAVTPALRELAQRGDGGVRAAAAQALGEVGTAADAALLCGAVERAGDEKQLQTAQRALVALGKRLNTPAELADSVLAGMKKDNGASRRALYEVCGELGGGQLLAALAAVAGGPEGEDKDAAVGALAKSDDPAALPHLTALLDAKPGPDHRLMIFRGVARLASAKGMDKAAGGDALIGALALAGSPEEKRILLGALGACPTPDALKAAEGCLDTEGAAAEAAVAWGRIARELVAGHRAEIGATAPKALEAARKAGLQKAAMQPLLDTGRALAAVAATGDRVRFEHVIIDREFRSEGVAVADFNRDGLKDIFTGDHWYAAPGWQAREVRAPEKYDPANGYSRCFAAFAEDVDRDGWTDAIVVGFPGAPAYWYRNPGGGDGRWEEHLLATEACGETPIYGDLTGDGKPVPVFAMNGRITWFRPGQDKTTPWLAHPMSPMIEAFAKFGHGLGMGDVDGDGRSDVLFTGGWWPGPGDYTRPDWNFHGVDFGPDCANMLVYDVNGDGRNDVITSSAHEYGVWWFEQGADGKFTRHEIDKSVSETHALILADMNNDGLEDLVTGKRYFAHGEHDPGALEPSVLCWYELRRPEPGGAAYTMRVIDNDSGVGTQFEVCDFDEDGLRDVVVSNKKGVHVFLQRREH